jgi:DNA-binding LacI/PurR family transcriptional regulator
MKKKQPTIKDIAEELGIAFSTVSRALQDNPRIALKTRENVWDVAKKLNYIPNPAAMLLKNNTTLSIGILIPSLSEEFFTHAITGIEDILEEKGFHTVIIQSRENFDREQKAIDAFLKMRIDGLIVSISGETTNFAHFRKLESFGIPIVFFDRVPFEPGFNKVICNTIDGAKKAIDLLVEKGCKKIALLNGPESLQASKDRLSGYISGLKKHQMPINNEMIKNCDLSKENAFININELFEMAILPDAIIAFNDYLAMYVMIACHNHNLIPNKDVIIIGFGNLPFTNYLENPPYASIEQYPIQIGATAARLLLENIEDTNEVIIKKEITIQTKLVIHQKNK